MIRVVGYGCAGAFWRPVDCCWIATAQAPTPLRVLIPSALKWCAWLLTSKESSLRTSWTRSDCDEVDFEAVLCADRNAPSADHGVAESCITPALTLRRSIDAVVTGDVVALRRAGLPGLCGFRAVIASATRAAASGFSLRSSNKGVTGRSGVPGVVDSVLVVLKLSSVSDGVPFESPLAVEKANLEVVDDMM